MGISQRNVEGITVVEMDDGKANALTLGVIEDLRGVLEAASSPVVLAGRPGMLCAGYDLETIRSGDDRRISELLSAGRNLFRDILAAPAAVVVACTGHAVAAGALLLLVADLRFAVGGAWRIGLNEVRIGMALPEFGVTVVNHRMSPAHATRAAVFGEIVEPARAREFGFVDHVIDDGAVIEAAVEAAREIAELPAAAMALTKQRRNARLLSALESVADA